MRKVDPNESGSLDRFPFVRWYGEDLAGHLQKVDPNESGGLDRFAFVRWYVDEEVSLDSAEEAKTLVGWGCKFSLIDLQ